MPELRRKQIVTLVDDELSAIVLETRGDYVRVHIFLSDRDVWVKRSQVAEHFHMWSGYTASGIER